MNKNELLNRTKSFAYSCIDITANLPNTYLGNHIKGQLIRSATSTAANYRATCKAQTKPTFIAKISIVVEECDESLFWLEMIIDKKLISHEKVKDLIKEADELTAIFVASRKTASQNHAIAN